MLTTDRTDRIRARNVTGTCNGMASNKRDYAIPETADKVREVLKRLEETASPGQQGGKGGRMDVMREVRDDVSRLLEKGYTAHQIASAINEGDIFQILPKSITQLMNDQGNRAITVSRAAGQRSRIRTESQNGTMAEQPVNGDGKQTSSRVELPASGRKQSDAAKSVTEPRKQAAKRFAGPRPDRN